MGYYVASLRTRYKGYSDTKQIGNGAWFAFWMHGPVHEVDMMEQTAGIPRTINYVNQYHNGWGDTYGGGGTTSTYYTKLTINENLGDTFMQDNWYKLALQWTEDQVTYYYNDVWAHYYKRNEANTQATFYMNTIADLTNATQQGQGDWRHGATYTARKSSYSDWGYNGQNLKAVPTAPMNVFLSTEIGGGWGGTPVADEIPHLPVWVEADYIAYYVPEGSSEAAN